MNFYLMVFLMSMGSAGLALIIWYVRARLWRRKYEEPAEPTPEVGTIRVVEKMHDGGTEYYVPLYYTGYSWRPFTAHREGEDWDYIESDTVAGCQEEVDEELERQKNKAHSKAMGEFKP